MNIFASALKNVIFTSRPHLWPSYLVLAGMCFKLVIVPQIPVALAEQSSVLGLGMSTIEALQSPNALKLPENFYENNFILAGSFVQSGLAAFSFGKPAITKIVKKSQTTFEVIQSASRVIVTAYSSTIDQTDSTPFISANGTYVYDGMVACNFLPFGTKVRFPEVYGEKIFVVEDRMALHNSHKIDIWMPSRQSALQFGVKKLAYEIVK